MRVALSAIVLTGLMLTACSSALRFVAEGGPYPRRGTVEQVQVIESEPGRAYDRVGRIEWDYTDTHFQGPRLRDALPALKQKAWDVGGDALVIREASQRGRQAPDQPLRVRADVIRWRP